MDFNIRILRAIYVAQSIKVDRKNMYIYVAA